MEEYCRTCLGYAPQTQSVHISYTIGVNKTISQVVNECASIQMSEQDSFPKYICSKCYHQLLVINEFRDLIIRTDMQLRANLILLEPYYDETSLGLSDGSSNSALPSFAESLIKSNSEYKIRLKDEIQKCLRANQESLQVPFVEPLQIQGNECTGSENAYENNKASSDGHKISEKSNSIMDFQSDLDGDSTEGFYTEESITRIRPGRKPSKTKKNKRKIHEFKCHICQKVLFGRSNRLEQHIIMAHSNIKNYICETCDKKFKNKQQLVNHTRVHTGEKPYSCDICNGCFASSQNLYNHKKKHTGSHKSYKCDLCEKAYATPGELESHKRITHTGEKPFLCEICSRAYSSARNLGLHIRSVHEKTEKCHKCGLLLSDKRIKQHMRKHTDKEENIRRYTCDKCGKGFFTPHALKKHQVVHTGERPYSCEICSKAFSQKSAVDAHMKAHSDVRGFCCELCAKTFKYKQHLQLHISKNHGEENAEN